MGVGRESAETVGVTAEALHNWRLASPPGRRRFVPLGNRAGDGGAPPDHNRRPGVATRPSAAGADDGRHRNEAIGPAG